MTSFHRNRHQVERWFQSKILSSFYICTHRSQGNGDSPTPETACLEVLVLQRLYNYTFDSWSFWVGWWEWALFNNQVPSGGPEVFCRSASFSLDFGITSFELRSVSDNLLKKLSVMWLYQEWNPVLLFLTEFSSSLIKKITGVCKGRPALGYCCWVGCLLCAGKRNSGKTHWIFWVVGAIWF